MVGGLDWDILRVAVMGSGAVSLHTVGTEDDRLEAALVTVQIALHGLRWTVGRPCEWLRK